MVVLSTLAAFTVLPHLVSNTSAGRIACLANQRATFQALVFFQAEHAGNDPRTLQDLKGPEPDPAQGLGRCPASGAAKYYYSPKTSTVDCPNPAH